LKAKVRDTTTPKVLKANCDQKSQTQKSHWFGMGHTQFCNNKAYAPEQIK
jgi:hypothetical protein